MRAGARIPWAATALAWACLCWTGVQASYTPYMDQSFYFDWDTRPVPIPVVAQCDTLNITWERGVATGPNNVGPYYLQVYTSVLPSTYIIPVGNDLSYNWAVPFAPDTLFQICMTDSNGNTGGCQRMMTVIESTNPSPSCPNVTFAATPLNVTGTVYNGPFSAYGWIPQCTDLQLQPGNGTAPFTYTIATTLHPPYNITSNNSNPVNWTVALSWASSFFVSVVDANGNSWARGPLHSGASMNASAPTCLSQISAATTVTSQTAKTGVPAAAAAGAGVGGAVVGLLVGCLIAYCCLRGRDSNAKEESVSGKAGIAGMSQYSAVPPLSPNDATLAGSTLGNRMTSYSVEPFRMPNEDGTLRPVTSPSEADYAGSVAHPTSEPDSQTSGPVSSGAAGDRSHVYVVHHDGGRAPVTVYTPDGTEVVELPPRYIEGSSTSPGGSSSAPLSDSLNQRRQAGPAPKKPRAPLPNPPSEPDPDA